MVTAPSVAPRLLVRRPQGVLRLTVLEAANLPQTDFGGLFCIDPYCSLQVSQAAVVLHVLMCLLQAGRRHQDHHEGERRQPGVERGVPVPGGAPPRIELQTRVREDFTITGKPLIRPS